MKRQTKAFATTVAALALLAGSCSGDAPQSTTDSAPSAAETEPAETESEVPGNSNETGNPAGESDAAAPPALKTVDTEWTQTEYELALIAELDQPTSMASRGGSDDLWVAEKGGLIKVVTRDTRNPDKEIAALDLVLDLSSEVSTSTEQGLLAITFAPDGRRLFVSYTDTEGDSVVESYDSSNGQSLPVESRKEILRLSQPAENHNGGHLTFGPDGFLYIGFGDGGGQGDPEGNGQNPETLLGSILRIDPDATASSPYTIPDGNPFKDSDEGADEVWLYGVRNPWRFSFDSANDDLWVADVGQNTTEEITRLRKTEEQLGKGANLGWNLMEGNKRFGEQGPPDNHTAPIHTYGRDNGRCSVTGGHVYRGQNLPELEGVYLFGDLCSGEIFGIESDANNGLGQLSVEPSSKQLGSFSEGPEGEIYVLDLAGQLLRLENPSEENASERL